MNTENKQTALHEHIWLWSCAVSVILVMLFALLKSTGQSLKLVIFSRTRVGKKQLTYISVQNKNKNQGKYKTNVLQAESQEHAVQSSCNCREKFLLL